MNRTSVAMLQWTNGLALVSLVSLQDIVSCYWHLQCHSLTNSVTSQPMHTSCLTNTVCMYACINQSINGGTNYPAGERHGKCPSTVFNSTPSHRLTKPLTQSITFSFPPQNPANMESLYDYGSRAGFWRLHRLFTKKKLPCTVFAVGMALERNEQACKAMADAGWEVASHGYRWLDYQNVDELTEREHIARTVQIHERLFGKRPVGIYQGKVSQYCYCRRAVQSVDNSTNGPTLCVSLT